MKRLVTIALALALALPLFIAATCERREAAEQASPTPRIAEMNEHRANIIGEDEAEEWETAGTPCPDACDGYADAAPLPADNEHAQAKVTANYLGRQFQGYKPPLKLYDYIFSVDIQNTANEPRWFLLHLNGLGHLNRKKLGSKVVSAELHRFQSNQNVQVIELTSFWHPSAVLLPAHGRITLNGFRQTLFEQSERKTLEVWQVGQIVLDGDPDLLRCLFPEYRMAPKRSAIQNAFETKKLSGFYFTTFPGVQPSNGNIFIEGANACSHKCMQFSGFIGRWIFNVPAGE